MRLSVAAPHLLSGSVSGFAATFYSENWNLSFLIYRYATPASLAYSPSHTSTHALLSHARQSVISLLWIVKTRRNVNLGKPVARDVISHKERIRNDCVCADKSITSFMMRLTSTDPSWRGLPSHNDRSPSKAAYRFLAEGPAATETAICYAKQQDRHLHHQPKVSLKFGASSSVNRAIRS